MKNKTKITVTIKGEPNYEVIKRACEQFYIEVMNNAKRDFINNGV